MKTLLCAAIAVIFSQNPYLVFNALASSPEEVAVVFKDRLNPFDPIEKASLDAIQLATKAKQVLVRELSSSAELEYDLPSSVTVKTLVLFDSPEMRKRLEELNRVWRMESSYNTKVIIIKPYEKIENLTRVTPLSLNATEASEWKREVEETLKTYHDAFLQEVKDLTLIHEPLSIPYDKTRERSRSRVTSWLKGAGVATLGTGVSIGATMIGLVGGGLHTFINVLTGNFEMSPALTHLHLIAPVGIGASLLFGSAFGMLEHHANMGDLPDTEWTRGETREALEKKSPGGRRDLFRARPIRR